MEQKKNKSPSKTNNKNNRTHQIVRLAGVIVILLAVIIALWLLLRGKTTTSGRYPDNIKDESLVCSSDSKIYDKLGSFSPAPSSTELKITAIFRGTDTLNRLSIKNLMTFESQSEAVVAEARSHANFNLGLQALNVDSGSFENKFSILDKQLLFNLTARKSDITDFSKAYFMLKSDKLPETLADYKAEYESQGFKCEQL